SKTFDVIVTDPPYGRASRSFGKKREEVYDLFLSKIGTDFKVKKRLVLLAPFDLKPLLKKHKLNLYKELELYIHKGLTRHIYVCSFCNSLP
ncbi:MAG: hypothetical protein JXA43_02555, partial [Candidatus Diapherotrites archaeon]|nr:hypothetical protein [Candidatus Diapherotrites archaeon]